MANMKNYITVAKDGTASVTIKKSEFIGYAAHIKNDAEARAFVDKIRKKHSDARHNVYAYVASENNIMRYSDDGEPQGTAGIPVLDVIKKSGVTDVALVVTRYFGGILLGAGGLVRAYSAAASAALEDAGICEFVDYDECLVECSYPLYQKLSQLFKTLPIIIDSTDFGENVTVSLAVKSGFFEELEKNLLDITAAKVKITKIGKRLDRKDI